MIENSDYIDIRFQETPRYKKPAGAYWIQTAAAQVLSPNELNSIWAYRIPSFLAAVSAVLLTYAIASLFMNKNSALLSGVFLSLSFLLNVEAHMAKTDALLLMSILISQYGLAKAYKVLDPVLDAFERDSILLGTSVNRDYIGLIETARMMLCTQSIDDGASGI